MKTNQLERVSRRGHPKSKTGCITCKARHVKCDETRPFCNRCVSQNRICEGYRPSKPKRTTFLSPLPLPLLQPKSTSSSTMQIPFKTIAPHPPLNYHPDATSVEKHCIDYFLTKSSIVIGSWFLPSFWRYHIPQIGYHDPGTRHIMIAVANEHLWYEAMRQSIPNDPRLDSNSCLIRHHAVSNNYGLALKYMAQNSGAAKSEKAKEKFVLTACALAQALCFIRGDFEAGMVHLNAGLEICARFRKERKWVVGSLEGSLIEYFDWITFGSRSIGDMRKPERHELEFEDLAGARRALELLGRESIRLVRLRAFLPESQGHPYRSPELKKLVQTHEKNFTIWSREFKLLLSRMLTSESMTTEEEQEIDRLLIMVASCRLWIPIGFHPHTLEPLTLAKELVELLEKALEKWASKGMNDWVVRGNYRTNKACNPILLFIAQKGPSTLSKRAFRVLLLVLPTVEGSIPAPELVK